MGKIKGLLSNNAVLTILFGLMMIFMPTSLVSTAVRVAGMIVILYGTYMIYVRLQVSARNIFAIVVWIVALLIGVYMVKSPIQFVSFIPTVLGFYLLITGIMKVMVLPVSGVLDIILGVVLLSSAYGLISLTIRILGIFVLAVGLADLKIG